MSAAEKQRCYRACREADPERRTRYLEKEKEKYMKSGINIICDVSVREQQKICRKWGGGGGIYHRVKERKRALQKLVTRPHSPEQAVCVYLSYSATHNQLLQYSY